MLRNILAGDWLLSTFLEGEGGGGAGGGGGEGGEGGAGGGAAGGEGGGGEAKTFDEKYVKELRAEAAANRKKATELEAKLKEREDADLSETDKLKKTAQEATDKLTATEGRVRERLGKAEVKTAAADARFIKPDLAYQLVKEGLEFNDDGEPTNAETLVKKLAEEHPYLVEATPPPGGRNPGNPAGGRGAGNADPKSVPSWREVWKK